MIDWSYTHFRVLMRYIAPCALVYTEMQTTGAIEHQPGRALYYKTMEKPIALQVGGHDPNALVKAAILAEEQGFDEINLNLGCPSDRVQAGRFGACLMKEPIQVAQCIRAMKQAVSIPVTAKTRIGVDEQDSYEFFKDFVLHLVEAGCDKLIVHARKAWLHGLSPKQNRTIPPLHYDYAYRIKQAYPDLPVVINGNIQTTIEAEEHLKHLDGIMVGRLACQNPFALSAMHKQLYPHVPVMSFEEIIKHYMLYLRTQFEEGIPLSLLIKPIMNMAHGQPFAKRWKEQLLFAQHNRQISHLQDMIVEG